MDFGFFIGWNYTQQEINISQNVLTLSSTQFLFPSVLSFVVSVILRVKMLIHESRKHETWLRPDI